MSFIKEINELHISLKSTIFCLVCIMPFWYVDIFLFDNILINTTPFYVPIIFSFCFSLVWFMVNLIITVFIKDILPKTMNATFIPFFIAALLAITWLSGATYIAYMLKWHLLTFVNVLFCSYIIRQIFWTVITTVISRRAYKNKT